MKILVIIVTYNAMQWAEKCFNSLRNSTIVPDIFVVDNGSSDNTQTYITQNFPEVIFHQSKENLGFGKANNIGLQYAIDNGYDYVYLLNQDAWILPNTLGELVKISKEYPKYGILSPFQMNADLYHIDSNLMGIIGSVKSNPDILNDIYNQKISPIYQVPVVMAAHWLITRECLLKVGGFSPSFPHYAEDDNYADRVHYYRFKVGIIPALKVVHDRGERIITKSKWGYITYTGSIRWLSNPNISNKKAFAQILYTNIKVVFKHKTLAPLSYLFKLLIHTRKIIKNKRESITKDCAFLEYTAS